MIESHLNNQNNPYLYNGKELDAETGFYYYGARYYYPKGSLWLSVDPLAEKYLDWSPYNYTFNNPINFIDPWGMEGEGLDWKRNKNGSYTAEKGDSAYTLAQDAGITPQYANQLVQAQLGKNYISKDGQEKSNVNVGDVVQVENPNKPKRDYIEYKNSQTTINKYNPGALDYSDELLVGVGKYTEGLKQKGGYLGYSTAKNGKGLFWKPNARGLNNLKGVSFNTTKVVNAGGFALGVALEVPEVINGYQLNNYEGNKQLAGGVGSVGGGWLGGMLAGGAAGLAGFETGPGVVITVVVGAGVGAFVGEEGVERIYDNIFK